MSNNEFKVMVFIFVFLSFNSKDNASKKYDNFFFVEKSINQSMKHKGEIWSKWQINKSSE